MLQLQRAQEVQQVLNLGWAERLHVVENAVCLRAAVTVSAVAEVGASVVPDSLQQVGSAPVMQEEQALAQSPERRGSELIWSRSTLGDTIGQTRTHVVNGEIRERLIVDRAHAGIGGGV